MAAVPEAWSGAADVGDAGLQGMPGRCRPLRCRAAVSERSKARGAACRSWIRGAGGLVVDEGIPRSHVGCRRDEGLPGARGAEVGRARPD